MVPLPPYARRVEYLEVGLSGTFSVITDFTADTGYIEAKLEAYSTNSFNPNGARWQYGFRKSGTANDDAHRLLLYTSTTYTGSGKRWDLGRGVSSPDSRILTTFPGVLNITKKWFNTSGREVPDNFRLFGTTADPPDAIPLRLYYFRFYDPTGSTIAAEFIPCRILDRGYVFDTVSGKFYGNSGTGDFVLGPDVREGVVPTTLNPFGVGRRQEEIRRVEYLESTGTQYVDTGVVPTGATGIDCDFAVLNVAKNFSPVFWSRGSSATDRAFCFEGEAVSGDTKGQARWDYGNYGAKQVRNVIEQGVRTTASVRNGTLTVAGSVLTRAEQTFTGAGSIILFNFCNYVNGERQMLSATVQPTRIYSCAIYDGSTLVRDFVPVAIGSTGYLLDRVSGQLFGNAGTGSFVLGPDIVPRLRVWGNGQSLPLFDISTPYPLAAGNPVTGTVNGDARSGILDSNLFTVNDAGGNYVGEFADLTPGGTDSIAMRWFDGATQTPCPGYCEIVQ